MKQTTARETVRILVLTTALLALTVGVAGAQESGAEAVAATEALSSAGALLGELPDHFKCYKIKKGPSASRTVVLKDPFDDGRYQVLQPVQVCNPVSKNDEGVRFPRVQYTCYEIRRVRRAPKEHSVVIENQFGTHRFTLTKEDTLCVPTKPPEPEVDEFPISRAEVTIETPAGAETVQVRGPTTVHVWVGRKGEADDSDGDGNDEVETEIVALELTGTSSQGPVTVRRRDPSRHPFKRSTGEIEETKNTQPGRLDLPPFAETGKAVSTFDVFFEVEVGGQVLHAHQPKDMKTTITHKPPREWETYEGPRVIELFDEQENPTGVKIATTAHTPRPVEVDEFPDSKAEVRIRTPQGTETVQVRGPTTVNVWVGREGEADDSDGDGNDEVETEIVALELTGTSSQGPVTVRRRDPSKHPFKRSTGEIEETKNTQPGRLDLPPFAETGKAVSTFNVFFEVEVGGRLLHAHQPKDMKTTITHKPPREWETYEGPRVIPLFDEDENPTDIEIATTAHTPRPVEVDEFPDSKAEVRIRTPQGTETVQVRGPTTVNVWVGREGEADDSDGDKLDEVATEIVALELTGTSSKGPVTVRRRDPSKHPFKRSTGEIEETKNTQPGRLDLPPFAETGKAVSTFDVFFEVEVGGRLLHAHQPKDMKTTITHKPPREWETYEGPRVIPLFDEDENPTGIEIATTAHTPRPVEVDEFPDSKAEVRIRTPQGTETVQVRGPTTVNVWVGRKGEADDSDGDKLDEVATEIVALELTGTSSLGPVTVRRRDPSRHPFKRSTGEIEETKNTQPGRLDLPPFAETGKAVSTFDVFFEVEVGGRLLHAHQPKDMKTTITHKPPRGGETYEGPRVIPLFDEDENPTGVEIATTAHTPRPRPGNPDLVVGFESKPVFQRGEAVGRSIAVFVTNEGSGEALGTEGAGGDGYMVDLVLSSDDQVPAQFAAVPDPYTFQEDMLLQGGRLSITKTLPGGATATYSGDSPPFDVTGVIPRGVPDVVQLCAVVDPGHKIDEANEANNTFCARIEVSSN